MSAEPLRDFRHGFRDGFREVGTQPRLQRRISALGVLVGGAVAIYAPVRLAA
ncbi:hypothetical protein [Gemmatimonas sp.]|jgi:hypothetical protein|uniref:hypothetical protein n=1 Tax=Gemmatimonas sp. TaxID=1962908 RepID=UPI0022BDD5EC|nr:hypothetical protein [Gemmatimonas sp.]MCZ8206442.1 hypothetical protein [Gemmatimonas sp.]